MTYNPGRLAGLLYLLLGLSVVRLQYIPNTLFVRDDGAATARNIVAHESLFRLGIVCDLLTGVFCILLTLALYQVFASVNHNTAVLMVILGGIMPAALDFFNVVNDVAALLLAGGANFLTAFDKPQREALAMLFLRLHDHGVLANLVFAGLWLFPFGLLVYRSRFLPRVLGIFLFIAGIAYLVNSFTSFLFPPYAERVYRIVSPGFLGEGPVLLWLLIRGAKPQAATSTASSTAAA